MNLVRFGLGVAAVLLLLAFGFGYQLGQQHTRNDIAAVVESLTTTQQPANSIVRKTPALTPTTVPATVRN